MAIPQSTIQQVINDLVKTHGEKWQGQIEKGVRQVADRWFAEDGDETAFNEFCKTHFYTDPQERRLVFERFQKNLESLYGNLHRISRDWEWPLQVVSGPVLKVDYLFANMNHFAHASEDMFKNKIAFAALLNFPIKTLEEKSGEGARWDRQTWAEVRLAEEFSVRVPAEVSQQRSLAYTAADDYINNYNIHMHHLLDEQGNRLFPEGLRLISHWGLRDELKAQYANPDGLSRQKMIYQVMRRIIQQEIPEKVIDNPEFDWNPFTNEVFKANSKEKVKAPAEPDTRYQHIRAIFQAERLLDPYYPHAPSLIDRRFKLNREIPEAEVKQLFEEILNSPVRKEIARLIRQRLGRDLEPFDIWYKGFRSGAGLSEEKLDQIVGKRYPSVEAFQKDLPFILRNLGFQPAMANFLADHIQVDPSRGAGHASGAMMREDKAHLRTRIPEGGMKYKGFNIAIHELGHNVEQVFSLNRMDYYTLNGVPNTAFTEAFAFVFQSRDLQVLGINQPDPKAEHYKALNDLWATAEIAGVALVDMGIWHWMYDHPEATAAEIHQAMVQIARDVWNRYFADIFGVKDQEILAIYSHIVDGAMYTPDYPLGHIISFQIEEYLKKHQLAPEMERMCRLGRLAPQVWMQQAVGSRISAQPMVHAAERALKEIK
ncbi:MAG: hypothetical protein Kow0037_05950 [Calditrichia bacterium]